MIHKVSARRDLIEQDLSIPVGNGYVEARKLVNVDSISVDSTNTPLLEDMIFIFWDGVWQEVVNADFEDAQLNTYDAQLLQFAEKVSELGYTFGDRNGEESRVLFELHKEAEDIISKLSKSRK